MTQDNKFRDMVAKLAIKTFTPFYVHNDPLIHTVCAMRVHKDFELGTHGEGENKVTTSTPQDSGEKGVDSHMGPLLKWGKQY